MSQAKITSYYNSRKRTATEDLFSCKNKIPHLENKVTSTSKIKNCVTEKGTDKNNSILKYLATKELPAKQDKNQDAEESHSVSDKNVPQKKSDESIVDVFSKKTNSANNVNDVKVNKTELVNKARKELGINSILSKLSNSSKLAELKESADRINKKFQKFKESKNLNLQEFKSIVVDVPSSSTLKTKWQVELLLSPKKKSPSPPSSPLKRPLISPRKVVVSPVKSPSKVPAYIRHASLASAETLPIPHHFRSLAELFRGMETVVSLLFNRGEKITFGKLKPSVQEMLKRNFSEKHLAQIKYLVPDFYNFEVQKAKTVSNSSNNEAYELTVTPNFPNDLKVMTPSTILERRKIFHEKLLQLVKQNHSQFLLTQQIIVPDDKLTRWHPQFSVDSVPDVKCARMPEMPNNEKYTTAQDVLTKARSLFNCNKKMERALEKLAQKKSQNSETAANHVNADQKSVTEITILNPALRNLPPALLEKVKAKQAAKALEAMTRSSEDEKNYMTYTRLRDLARTLRNIFVTERKNVLALNIVLSKLDNSFKANVSATDFNGDIKILHENFPDWIKLLEVKNTVYIKLNRMTDIKEIQMKLDALADKYKSDEENLF